MSVPVLELSAISKDYRGLRPLRLERLTVTPGDRVALVGFDQPSAEVMVNLVTGAALPDTGEVRLFGRPTAEIADSSDWLAAIDRFGIVSPRAVLLDALTVAQNLAVPFTLEIEPPAADVRDRAAALAREVGLREESFDRAVGELDAVDVLRVRFARALALDPAILLFEHPTAGLPRTDVVPIAVRAADIARRRAASILALTSDRQFADAVADRVLALDPATGRLIARGGLIARLWRT